MAWRRIGDKPLSNQCWPDSLTHICGIKGRWVNRNIVHVLLMHGVVAVCMHINHNNRHKYVSINKNICLKIIYLCQSGANEYKHIITIAQYTFLVHCKSERKCLHYSCHEVCIYAQYLGNDNNCTCNVSTSFYRAVVPLCETLNIHPHVIWYGVEW